MENYVDESVYERGPCDEIEEGKFSNTTASIPAAINVNPRTNWWATGTSQKRKQQLYAF